MIPVRPWPLVVLGCVACLASCSMPVPLTRDEAVQHIATICDEKYGYDVATHIVGESLYASMDVPGMLRRLTLEGNLSQADSQKISDLLVVTTQICLSTRPQLQFYVLRIFDPERPGAELRYVTYLDDVRRLYAGALGETEFFARRVQEVKLQAEDLILSDVWLEREVQLGEFLAVQMAARIKALALADRSPIAAWQLADCSGWYDAGVFTLLFARKEPVDVLADQWPEEILAIMAQVLRDYRFEAYRSILLNELTTKQVTTIDPATLTTYLKHR